MIRVNLLPFRLERKKENIRRQVSVFFLFFLFSCLVALWYTLKMNHNIEQIRQDTEALNRQIALYKAKADRVTQIKKELEILKNKLAVVNSLKSKRNEQWKLLDDLPGHVMAAGKMWIESLKADASTVEIKGIAFDNPIIAEFMEVLEASNRFSQIDLKRSVVKEMGGVW